MDHNWPSVCCWNHLKEAFAGQRSMGTWVIEVTEFHFEVSLNLRGHWEASMTSEPTNMAFTGNMHMDARVIEVTQFNSEVNHDLRAFGGH